MTTNRTLLTYKDFVTGKIKRTSGKFLRWERGGVLNAVGAIIQRKQSVMFIPKYLLTPESLDLISKNEIHPLAS